MLRRSARAAAVYVGCGGELCPLTNKVVTDWSSHKATTEFRLSKLVAERISSSTQPVPLNEVWRNLSLNPERLLAEFASTKTSRRLGHLSASLEFLKRHNVIMHSTFFYNALGRQWQVSRDFTRVALVGETILRNELTLRALTFLPNLDEGMLATLVAETLSATNLARFYDRVNLNRLLPSNRRNCKLNTREKASLLAAILGELNWFVSRTRATNRTHNNALFPPSDVLILNVLSSHSVESLLTEILHSYFEPLMARMRGIWKNFPESTPQQLFLKPRTRHALSLSMFASSREEGQKNLSEIIVKPLLLPAPVAVVIQSGVCCKFDLRKLSSPPVIVGSLPERTSLSPQPTSVEVCEAPSVERMKELLLNS